MHKTFRRSVGPVACMFGSSPCLQACCLVDTEKLSLVKTDMERDT